MASPLSRFISGARSRFGNIGTQSGGGLTASTNAPYGPMRTGLKPPPVSPFTEAGVSGTAIWGGFVQVIERDPRLVGQNRYRTVSDMLANVSIVAASVRFYLDLVASPDWAFEPAEDLGDGESSDAAKAAAELVQSAFEDMATPWTRIVRRSAMYRFHGFGIAEWTAKKRKDGLIGFDDIESRPQHTIERWEPDLNGTILGVWQRSPQNGKLYWIPRQKFIYLVDDMLTDSPDGLGLFRHLIDPSDRIQRYLKLEGQGYERDLRGIPLGRAPIAALQEAVAAGKLTAAQADKALDGMRKFLKLEVKLEDTSLLIDSSAYTSLTGDGEVISAKDMWGVELIKGSANSLEPLDTAIRRLSYDMARIMGTEILMIGEDSGSRALSADKSRNLYLSINATVDDIREGVRRDAVMQLCRMNGIPEELAPTAKVEDVAFKDVAAVADVLSKMALAGATLAPDDPAINDVRDLAGISRAPMDTASTLLPNADPEDSADQPLGGSVSTGGGGAVTKRKTDDDANLRAWLTGRNRT